MEKEAEHHFEFFTTGCTALHKTPERTASFPSKNWKHYKSLCRTSTAAVDQCGRVHKIPNLLNCCCSS